MDIMSAASSCAASMAGGDVRSVVDDDLMCHSPSASDEPDIMAACDGEGSEDDILSRVGGVEHSMPLAASRGAGREWDTFRSAMDTDFDAIVGHMLQRLRPERFADFAARGTTVRSACLCAGTGCTEWVMKTILRTIRRYLGQCTASHETTLFCESSPFKRRFIYDNHGSSAAVFWDVAQLASDCAWQGPGRLGSSAKVPLNTDIVFSGPSCRDLSMLNNKRSELASVISERSGSSGVTFAGTLAYIRRSSAKLVVLEQVPGLLRRAHACQGGSNNKEAWETGLSDAGLHFLVCQWRTSHFFLPQTRDRVYTIAASPSRCGLSVHEVVERLSRTKAAVSELASVDHVQDLSAYLLPRGHLAVKAVEAQLSLQKKRTVPRKGPRCIAGSRSLPAWTRQHRAMFTKHAVPWVEPVLHQSGHGPCGYSPMERDNAFYQSLSDREKHMIVFLQHKFGNDSVIPWDLHDSLERLVPRIGTQCPRTVRTITPGAKLWCAFLRPQRFLIGVEKMSLQGVFPDMYCGRYTSGQLSDLAGNAFSTTVIAAIVLALLAEFQDVLPDQ